jgi:uncharacterized glyoxalase superfamily protein PhnB
VLERKNIPTICPFFIVKDVELYIDFLKEIFEITVLCTQLDTTTGIMKYAELQIYDAMIMILRCSEVYDQATANQTMIKVRDCKAYYTKALACGAQSVREPVYQVHSKEWFAGIYDLYGNIWWLTTYDE